MAPKKSAPKRKKGDASTSVEETLPEITMFFHNDACRTAYEAMVNSNKTVIAELRFMPERPHEEDICNQLAERQWQHLCDPQGVANISIVREFYANAKTHRTGDRVNVRNKMVDFSAEAIRAYYRLPLITNIANNYFNFAVNYEAIISELCCPRARWSYSTQDPTRPINLPGNTLSKIAKAWLAFISGNLMPSTQRSEIVTDRVILLYSICKRMHVDAARVIRNEIASTADGATSGGLGFGCLITALAKQAGVRMLPNEATVAPKLWKHANLLRYEEWDGGIPRPDGLGFIVDPDHDLPPPPLEPIKRMRAAAAVPDAARARQRAGSRPSRSRPFSADAGPSTQTVEDDDSDDFPWESQFAQNSQIISQLGSLCSEIQDLRVAQEEEFRRRQEMEDRFLRRMTFLQQQQTQAFHHMANLQNQIMPQFNVSGLPPFPESLLQPYASPMSPIRSPPRWDDATPWGNPPPPPPQDPWM